MGDVTPIAPIPIIEAALPIAAIPWIVLPSPRANLTGIGFRVADLPPAVQQAFRKGAGAWREAARAAIAAGITDASLLADLIFFMQHPERMSGDVGRPIERTEDEFIKLRAEWELDLSIARRFLKPSFIPDVFLPENRSRKYEEFVARRTTGKVTLMIHGRNSDGKGPASQQGQWLGGFRDALETYERMQETVESLRAGDSLYFTSWQFNPLFVPIPPTGTGTPPTRNWGHLLTEKAAEGVKIRVIIAQHLRMPFYGNVSPFMTNLSLIDNLVNALPAGKRDNFKYIVSALPDDRGVHHQKLMIAIDEKRAVAYCGGLDLSDGRNPRNWWVHWVWHDAAAKLEGLIARDFERQFVELWNRDRGKSTVPPLAGWKGFERLTLGRATAADKAGAVNRHPVQMQRTVSEGIEPSKIRRDDIWRGYFRLIGRATRFIYLEDQYFNEPKLADALVQQVRAVPGLIVMILAGTGTDDRQEVNPNLPPGFERDKQQALVDVTNNGFALRLAFFEKLKVLHPTHLRVYTLNYRDGITHSKLLLVDDAALTLGSANANPRGFFLDTEVNFTLDHAESVRDFRLRLWAHNLGLPVDDVARWNFGDFFPRWDAVAKQHDLLRATPEKMKGEGVIPFLPWDDKDKRYRKGRRGPIRFGRIEFPAPDVLF